jgi:hypothetical protein
MMLNDNLLITSINDDEEKSSVLERIISESVTIREILDEAEDKLKITSSRLTNKLSDLSCWFFLKRKETPFTMYEV